MSQPHKEILDYCFYNSEKDSSLERYYRRGYYLLIEKIDILSMLPNRHINVQIINVWCNAINHNSICDGVRPRFIFSLDHNDALIEHMAVENSEKLFSNCKSSWDYWLDTTMDRLCLVDMIFIPFQIENHYVAAVVDFIDAKVHYLDNRKYSDSVQRVTFCDAAEALCKSLSSYLVSKNHPKAKDILTFELKNIKFPWQTSRVDSDCGVYLMHHMKNFDGVVYTSPDMNKVAVRNVLRAQIVASIILSNENETRLQVIDKAYTFYKDKPTLLELLAKKKKEKNDEFIKREKKEAEEKMKNMSEIKKGKKIG
ncbi:hypothetical protein ACS0TY_030844 [Phlomoides rotata]